MKTLRILPLYLSLLLALTLGLQNCKKTTPDPVKPVVTTPPGSTTTTPGSGTTTPGSTTTSVSITAPVFSTAVGTGTSGIASTSMIVTDVLESNGGTAISQHGHVWSKTNQTPTLTDSKTELGATTGPFPFTITSKLTGLEANTTYYVRPYATNDKGTSYGGGVQLKTTTISADPNAQPIVETNEAANVTTNGVQFSIQLLSAGGSNIKLDSYGVLYDTDPTKVDNGTGGGQFILGQLSFDKLSGSLTTLLPNATYYARAYANYTFKNQTGGTTQRAFGKVVTFKTLSDNLTGTWIKLDGTTPYAFDSFNKNYLQASGALVYMAEPRTGKFYSYNPTTNEIATLNPYATTNVSNYLNGFDGFSLGANVYLLHSDPQNPTRALFQEYNPATRVWINKTPFTGPARSQGISMSINGKGYYGMGFNYVNNTASMLTDWWEYDPGTNKWTQKATPKPASRFGAASFVIGDKGYLGMGGTYNKAGLPGGEWWEYSPADDSWTKKATPPVRTDNGVPESVPGAQLAFSTGNGKGYYLYDDTRLPNADRSVQVFEYDPIADRWAARSRFSGPFRRPFATLGSGQRGLLFGGFSNAVSPSVTYKDIWSFTP